MTNKAPDPHWDYYWYLDCQRAGLPGPFRCKDEALEHAQSTLDPDWLRLVKICRAPRGKPPKRKKGVMYE